jgi:hypothetical protein
MTFATYVSNASGIMYCVLTVLVALLAAPVFVLQVQGKRWKVNLNSRQEASLLLSAVNLPGGVQVSWVLAQDTCCVQSGTVCLCLQFVVIVRAPTYLTISVIKHRHCSMRVQADAFCYDFFDLGGWHCKHKLTLV